MTDRPLVPALALALGAAAGLLGGYLAFGGSAPAPLDDSAGALRLAPLAQGEAAAGAEAPPPVVAPSGGFRTLSDALAAIPPDPVPPAAAASAPGVPDPAAAARAEAGEITGMVSTEDGAPLAGAVVRAIRMRQDAGEPEKRRDGLGAPPVPDVETHVRESVTTWRKMQADTSETTTGPDGRYRFGDLAPDAHLLQAWAVGHVCEPVNPPSGRTRQRFAPRGPSADGTRIEPGGTLDFLAKAVVEVTIDVRLPDGSAPARARLGVSGPASGDQPWTPAEPTLRCTPGQYQVAARVGESPPLRADEPEYLASEATFQVAAGAPPPPVVLQCRARAVLKGRIDAPAADLVAGAQVRALRLSPDAPPDPDRLKQSGRTAWASATNPVFVFRDLPPGRYLVAASRSREGTLGPTATVDVGEGLARVDCALPPREPGRALVVRAVAPDGRALGDVSIAVRVARGGNAAILERTRTPDGGHRLVVAADLFQAAPGETPPKVTVQASASGFGWKSAELLPGQTEVTIQFAEQAMLEVQVAGYRGSGLEGDLSVGLETPRGGADGGGGNVRTMSSRSWRGGGTGLDPDGRCRFGPVEAVPQEVVLFVGSIGIQRVPVALRPGPNACTVTLPPLYRLTVYVDGATAGNAGLRDGAPGSDENLAWARIDAGGRATFDRLPAGRFRVSTWGHGGGSGSMLVTLPAEGVVRFVPDPEDAMRVEIDGDDGLLGKAGLRDGDLLIAVNGEGFTAHAGFVALLTAAAGEAAVRLTALRGSATVEAQVAPKALLAGLAGAGALGGSLEATSRK